MTQEDKELLLKELSARLPYGVMLSTPNGNKPLLALVSSKKYDTICVYDDYCGNEDDISEWEGGDVEFVKPYLRPMSSMTDEEILELYKITYDTWYSDSLYYKNEEWINFRDSIKNNNLCFKTCIWLSDINKVINWLLKHHFDYRGLIPKCIALEAHEGMYNIK